MGYSAVEFRRDLVIFPRRVGLTQLLALGFMAGVLAACGVRGDPEYPQSQSLAAPLPSPSDPRSKVFTEQSVVQRSTIVPNMAPEMPPKEWEKYGKDYQPAAASKKKSREAEAPDRPFVLDSLL
jgi:predicted small lipoprotein YifL